MITIKWKKKDFILDFVPGESIASFKNRIEDATGIMPSRQRLFCRKAWKGNLSTGDVIKDDIKIMLIGSVVKDKIDNGGISKAQDQKTMSNLGRKEVIRLDTANAAAASTSDATIIINVRAKGARYAVCCALDKDTVGDVKRTLEKAVCAKPKQQRLIFKGKKRGDEESLRSAGLVKTGLNLILLFDRSFHEHSAAEKVAESAEKQLITFEALLVSVEARVKHRLFDGHSLALDMAVLEDRLSTLVSAVANAPFGDWTRGSVLQEKLESLKTRAGKIKSMSLRGER